jgi:hypothetical protein
VSGVARYQLLPQCDSNNMIGFILSVTAFGQAVSMCE